MISTGMSGVFIGVRVPIHSRALPPESTTFGLRLPLRRNKFCVVAPVRAVVPDPCEPAPNENPVERPGEPAVVNPGEGPSVVVRHLHVEFQPDPVAFKVALCEGGGLGPEALDRFRRVYRLRRVDPEEPDSGPGSRHERVAVHDALHTHMDNRWC